MKRTCQIVLVLAVGVLLPGAFAAQYGDYTYVSSGTNITITAYMGTASVVAIPETIEALPVATIGAFAFENRTNITDLVIPGSVRSIEYNAFLGCSSITNLILEEGMDGLGNPAFVGCDGLRIIRLPASAVNASPIAFGCPNLTSYTINATNPAHSSLDGVWFNKNHTVLVGFPRGITGRYVVPDGVTTIGGNAFGRCLLDSVMIPESVTDIGTGAFSYGSIFGMTIPQNVSSIGEYAFYGCANLSRIAFLGNEPAEPYFPQWMFHDTLVEAIHYRAGTSWGYSWAGIHAVRCTAFSPELIPHEWILSDFPGLSTDEDYELAAAADQDGDGMPSWEEYVASTSPTNSADYLSVVSIAPATVIAWASATNRFYSVYFSTNLNSSWPSEPKYRIRGNATPQYYTNDFGTENGFHRIEVELYQ